MWGRHLWSAPRRLAGMWGSEHRGQRPGHLPACQGQDPTRLPAATPHHRCRGRTQTVTAPASCSAPSPGLVRRWRGSPARNDGWTSRGHCQRRTCSSSFASSCHWRPWGSAHTSSGARSNPGQATLEAGATSAAAGLCHPCPFHRHPYQSRYRRRFSRPNWKTVAEARTAL